MTENQQLLADFANSGSDSAFRELLGRYVGLVYSAAVRLVGGDPHWAQDVTQIVFVDLAKQARTLPPDVMRGGWLHRHTVLVAATMMRGERRRQLRERQAVEMSALKDNSIANLMEVAPILDEAINQLGPDDRAAVMLRFFEQLDFRFVGKALGSSEEAARKRVSRALEKLEVLLKHRGVAFSAAALGAALQTQAVAAAPVGLAAAIAGPALAGATAGGMTLTMLKLLAMTKLKMATLGTVLVVAVATPVLIQHRSQTQLQNENQLLHQEIEGAAAENVRLSNWVHQAERAQTLSEEQRRELLKLRGEVGILKRQLTEIAKTPVQPPSMTAPANSLQTETPMDPAEEERQKTLRRQQLIAKMGYAKNWMLAFREYAQKNQGQLPDRFDLAASLLPERAQDETLLATNQFEIVFQGDVNRLTNVQSIVVLRESQSQPYPSGGFARTYGFADGHSEVRKEEVDDFSAWEAQHIIPKAGATAGK